MERAQERAEGQIDAVVHAEPTPNVRPLVWWIAQAELITETCAKCEGPMTGQYITPTQGTMGECAVVANCRICGTERVVIAGRGGIPYSDADLAAARGHQEPPTPARSTVWRRAQKVYRPPRVAGGQGKTRDNKLRWRERDAQR